MLVYDVSRFGRFDPDEAAHWEYQLRQAGVTVTYTHEPGVNERGLSGYLVKGLKRVMAHDYSLKLSQVVSRGLRAHAALGDWTGGRPPSGFRRVVRASDGTTQPLPPGRWKAKGETVVLEREPAAAEVVAQIFTWYVEHGLGTAAISHRLNQQGVPAPESLRRSGAVFWTKGTIRAILNNPLYRGTVIYGKARYSEIGRFVGGLTDEQLSRKANIPLLKETPLGENVTLAQWTGAIINFHLNDHINQLRHLSQS